jgi:NAD(P)-dependent dehydrogenase (short-subunit alcohol dehydrogenase family)
MAFKQYIKRGIHYILHGQPIQNVTANISVLAPNDLLKGRTALVTGGTSGIGYAIAKAYINAGANVIITGRSMGRISKACQKISAETGTLTSIQGIELNNTDVQSFPITFKEILTMSPTHNIDILVNNAGVLGGHIALATEEEYDTILDTNLKGAFFLTKVVANHMKEHSIQGNILNIASSSSLRPADSAYTLSKWGIRGFTLGMAKTLAPHGIVVNGLAPGQTATPMLKKDSNDGNLSCPRTPLGRFATPEEIANMAVILVSDMSRSIMGDIIYMTGGSGLLTYEDNTYIF